MNEIEKTKILVDYLRYRGFPEESLRAYKHQEKLYLLKPGKHIYIIQLGDTDIYKIGFSKDPDKRIKQLQSKCPIPLKIIYTNFGHDYEFVEKYLHYQYREQRVKGEWFQLSTEDIVKITSWFIVPFYQFPEFSIN